MSTRGGIDFKCGHYVASQSTRGIVRIHAYSRGADFAFTLLGLTVKGPNAYKILGFTDSESHANYYLQGVLPAVIGVAQLPDDAYVRHWAEVQASNISRDALVSSTIAPGVLPRFRVAEAKRQDASLDGDLDTSQTALLDTIKRGAYNLIVLSSAVPGVGKSRTAKSISAGLAGDGRRVLLIDGDLRNPTLSRELRPSAQVPDLQTWYTSPDNTFEQIFQLDNSVFFLPSPVEEVDIEAFLAGDSLREKLHQFRQFDFVIIDTPPVIDHNDAVLILGADIADNTRGQQKDCALLVSSYATLPEVVTAAAMNRFEQIGVPVIGEVVNHYNEREKPTSRLELTIERAIAIKPVERAAIAFRVRKAHEPFGRRYWLVLANEEAGYRPIGSTDSLDLETLLTIRQEGPWARFD